MKDTDNFTLEDYLSNPDFRNWVVNGGYDLESSKWVSNQSQLVIAEHARAIVLATKSEKEEIPGSYIDEVVYNTFYSLNQVKPRRNWFKIGGIAASISLVLASFWYFVKSNGVQNAPTTISESNYNNQILQLKNNSSDVLPIELPDGSSVLLDSGSELEYPINFDFDERKVKLSGGAFFEISKDQSRPFLVSTEEMITRVLGTSFRINANKNRGNFTLIVKSGKVSVSSTKNKESIDLAVNEELVFNRADNSLKKKLVDDKLIKAVTPENTKETFFNDVPISQIFESISKNYHIPVIIEGSTLSECSLTTSFKDEPLFEKIKIICQAIGPSTYYEIDEEKIIINTKGCNN